KLFNGDSSIPNVDQNLSIEESPILIGDENLSIGECLILIDDEILSNGASPGLIKEEILSNAGPWEPPRRCIRLWGSGPGCRQAPFGPLQRPAVAHECGRWRSKGFEALGPRRGTWRPITVAAALDSAVPVFAPRPRRAHPDRRRSTRQTAPPVQAPARMGG